MSLAFVKSCSDICNVRYLSTPTTKVSDKGGFFTQVSLYKQCSIEKKTIELTELVTDIPSLNWQQYKYSGPSCSKLTMLLVNDSLEFTSSDTQIC